jgi:chromosome segregation protein
MQIREVAAQADTGAQDKQLQLNLLGSSDAAFQQRNRDLAIAEGRLAKLEPELQQAKFELLQLESAVARLRTECSGHEVDQKTSLHRHDGLAADLEQVRKQEAAAAAAAAGMAEKVEAALAEKSRLHNAAAAAQQALAGLTGQFRDAQRKLQDIDRQLAQRGARLKLLQQLQERWEGFGEGAKAVLQGRLEGALAGSRAVPLMQGLEVQPEFGRALEALLGSAAEAIGVADVATAQRVLAQLEQDQIGSAILRVGGLGRGQVDGLDLTPLPSGLLPAAAAIRNVDPAHPAAAVLGSCYVADDLSAFLEFWRANPGFAFLAVATRKGEVVDSRGLVSGGHSGGRKGASGIVQRDIELRETARLLADEQKAHEQQRARIDSMAAAMAAAEQELEQRRADVLAVTQSAAAVQAEHRTSAQAAQEVSARLRKMEGELAALVRARDEAQARWAKAQEGLAAAEKAAAGQRDRILALEAGIAEGRTERDAKRDSLAQARLDLAERRQKVEVLDRGLGEMERRRRQLAELLAQREGESEAWTEQAAALESEAADQRRRGEQLSETIGVAQQQVEKVRADLVDVEREIDGLDAAQSALREKAESAHEDLSRHEVQLAETRQRGQFLSEEVAREFQADIAALDWKMLLWRAEDEPEGMKTLDLDDDEEPAAPAEAAGPTDGRAARPPVGPTGEEPAPQKARKRKPKARGEPTEADLAALEATNWDEVKATADALRQRLNGMGAVNLVAIEEYAELKQRHDFLLAQSGDLSTAKADLLKAIDEINRTSQQQFAVAFEQIKKNFAYTFQTLFGGGRADLNLAETEDILESGIDIVAQPPGTKLKSISLLSGGQRALTAVALLFALYMVKPSPFCLLDELDAPLDETNIGRFTELLRKFVPQSQFIIITHNKRTVAAASAIYGVTMEERGVSKTISMRFNHERGEAEAHPQNLAEAVASAPAAVPGA